MEHEKVYDSSLEFKRKIGIPRHILLERWAGVSDSLAGNAAVFDRGGRVIRTFAQIDAHANRVAERLHASGVRGAVIALQGANSPAWIECLLGIWMADGVVLLEDKNLSAAARANAEESARAVMRIKIDDESSDPIFEKISGSARRLPREFIGTPLIKLTSGTSGAPRAILFTAAQLAADADQICTTMGITPADRNFGVISFSHSYGFSNLITPLITHGVPLVVSNDALPRAMITAMAQSGATVLPAVPALFDSMASLGGDMPGLRLCISAGAPLRTSVADAFRERFGLKLHSFYGASECGGICYDATDQRVDVDGFVGTPMHGVTLNNHATQDGHVQVRVTSAAVGVGALIPHDGSIERFDGFFPSDWLSGSTTHGYQIIGRESDWINMAGRKIDPTEIEAVLRSIPGVGDALVLGVTDARRGQKICALVVGDPRLLSVKVLQHQCELDLTRWQIPREIRIVARLPINDRGKISRHQIASMWDDHSVRK